MRYKCYLCPPGKPENLVATMSTLEDAKFILDHTMNDIWAMNLYQNDAMLIGADHNYTFNQRSAVSFQDWLILAGSIARRWEQRPDGFWYLMGDLGGTVHIQDAPVARIEPVMEP